MWKCVRGTNPLGPKAPRFADAHRTLVPQYHDVTPTRLEEGSSGVTCRGMTPSRLVALISLSRHRVHSDGTYFTVSRRCSSSVRQLRRMPSGYGPHRT